MTSAAVERVGLDQHEVGRGDGDRRRLGRHELALDVDALEALHERRALVAGVDGEHADVAAPGDGHGR